jgi:hypothetical protein
LLNELRKYDPVADGRGGFPMKWGDKLTKAGGHFNEIRDLQRGLKRDIAKYNQYCGNGGNGPGALPRYIDENANRDVPTPVIPDTQSMDVSPPEPAWFLPLMPIIYWLVG